MENMHSCLYFKYLTANNIVMDPDCFNRSQYFTEIDMQTQCVIAKSQWVYPFWWAFLLYSRIIPSTYWPNQKQKRDLSSHSLFNKKICKCICSFIYKILLQWGLGTWTLLKYELFIPLSHSDLITEKSYVITFV